MIEYATGRYTRKAVVDSFRELIGPRASWCGLWICMVSFLIGCYYSVILGWCFYYFIYCIWHDLPTQPEQSQGIFKEFAMESKWPILTTGLAVTLACLCVVKGVKTIEKVCLCLVPVLLLILAFTFVWALSRPSADLGLLYLFKPNWASLGKPRMWVDALSQNAFDTAAGAGLLVPYASYMTRNHGIVRYATLIPAANNLISLIAGMTIFSAVFSTMLVLRPQYTEADIINILMNSGPGNTGLTFIWLPVLFETAGTLGRALACLFFLCLSFAGLTSLIASVEQFTHTLEDWGMRRLYAVFLCLILMFGISQASANDIMILTNQDFVWGFALVINGLLLLYLVWHVGALVYREEFINEYGTDDWHLAVTWDWVVRYIAPVEAVVLIVWWTVSLISSQTRNGPEWYELGTETFMLTLVQWAGLMVLLIAGNMAAVYFYFRRRYRRGESTRLIGRTYT
ncbi:sodium dependent neurotransmitter transporter [Plakobranchus ocellatus]|uniref:Sodium dependent neurotransmitter transporter n=1 Tax=Plakobranchus ocellatus TaxID=259542 RepID=A0AAV4AH07_9GAST|nr:sodium dependent neurotransmitter transporter [Plakobranchus ocellatus]